MTSSDIYVFKVFVLVTHVTKSKQLLKHSQNHLCIPALMDLNSEEQKGEQN